jgi:hypothetical protein
MWRRAPLSGEFQPDPGDSARHKGKEKNGCGKNPIRSARGNAGDQPGARRENEK